MPIFKYPVLHHLKDDIPNLTSSTAFCAAKMFPKLLHSNARLLSLSPSRVTSAMVDLYHSEKGIII